MSKLESTQEVLLEPLDNDRLAKLCGPFNENLHLLERHMGVEINNRGNRFLIIGIPTSVKKACHVLQTLYELTLHRTYISTQEVMHAIQATNRPSKLAQEIADTSTDESPFIVYGKTVSPRTPNQRHYLNAMQSHDINFGIGPAGTGKTFLAVACALSALEHERVTRIILVRPAVEAGESLGFLPGDVAQKIDPYLRPLYDSLYEILGLNRVNALLTKGIIEIVPLAYMRGRTLNDSFIILDEGQNATKEQMKMFLTRIGFGSRAVITGDITQTDLPKRIESGLRHAITLLQNIDGIHFSFFKSNDIVRHPMVQRIIEAYEQEKEET